MRASATAKLLKWGCSTQSVSHNGFGIDRGYPSLTPNANKPHSTAERARKGIRIWAKRSHESHMHILSWTSNTTLQHNYTEHSHTSFQRMSCCLGYLCVHQMVKWTICCGFQSRTALCVGRRVLAMIGRLRPVERPIWPHFYSDGSADRFPAAESPGGWVTHIYTHIQ